MRSPNKGRPPVAPAYRVLTTSGTTGLAGHLRAHPRRGRGVGRRRAADRCAGRDPAGRAGRGDRHPEPGPSHPAAVRSCAGRTGRARRLDRHPAVRTRRRAQRLPAAGAARLPLRRRRPGRRAARRPPAHPPHRRRLRRRAAHPGPAAPHPRGLGLRAREGGGRRRQRRASRDARFQGPAHNLVNHAQPLIRYELSDAATLSAGANPAGRPYRCLTSVDGRSADILRLPARGGGRTAVHPSALGAAVGHLPQLRQYQFVLDERGLHARVVLAPDAPSGTAEDLRAALVRALEATGAIAPAVDVEEAAALQREPSGKFRLVTVPMTPTCSCGRRSWASSVRSASRSGPYGSR